jgi:hypothetical protein
VSSSAFALLGLRRHVSNYCTNIPGHLGRRLSSDRNGSKSPVYTFPTSDVFFEHKGVTQNGHGQGVRVSHLPSRIGLLEAFVLRDGEHGAKLSHVETQSNQ